MERAWASFNFETNNSGDNSEEIEESRTCSICEESTCEEDKCNYITWDKFGRAVVQREDLASFSYSGELSQPPKMTEQKEMMEYVILESSNQFEDLNLKICYFCTAIKSQLGITPYNGNNHLPVRFGDVLCSYKDSVIKKFKNRMLLCYYTNHKEMKNCPSRKTAAELKLADLRVEQVNFLTELKKIMSRRYFLDGTRNLWNAKIKHGVFKIIPHKKFRVRKRKVKKTNN